MSHAITCPSGLSGVVRGLKVREEKILADRKLAKSNTQLDELLRACWLETHDAGLYENGANGPDWDKVLQGDRFHALLQVRIATYGPEYAFSISCSDPRCRARFEWEVDLRELPVRALPAASREAFLSGNRFEAHLPDANRKVVFKLMTGADERKLPMLRRNADGQTMTAVLAYRALEIEGVAAHDKRRFIEDLSFGDADALMRAMDEADCGVETKIDVECPECFGQEEVELPFGPTFFRPVQRRKTTTTTSASSAFSRT